MKPIWLLPVALGLAGPVAGEQTAYRDARVRHVEPGVTLHRATEAEAEPAVVNLPWLPGDRAWTDASGRLELQFADGSLVQVATSSKLDYAGQHQVSGADVAVVRLWTGSLYLLTRGSQEGPGFEVETPDGVIAVREAGVYRIDVVPGETRVSVLRGHAQVDSGAGNVELYSGDRTYAVAGRAPETPHRFDLATADEFDDWSRGRRERTAGYSPPGLPAEIQPYTAELEQYGTWSVVTDVGYVWRPSVAQTWQPYGHGRWAWTSYGWSWVGYEPWGWAPFHYGRWGHSLGVGWYWIPDRSWSGAWVSWSVGDGYVGWCPRGYRGRPVYGPRRGGHYASPHGRQRHAVPRGSLSADGSAWQYAHSRGLGARDLSRHRVGYDRVASARLATLTADQQPGRNGLTATSRALSTAGGTRAGRATAGIFDRARLRGPGDRRVSMPTARTTGRRDRSLDAARRVFDRRGDRTGSSPGVRTDTPRRELGAESRGGARPGRGGPDGSSAGPAATRRGGRRDRSSDAIRRLDDRGRGRTGTSPGARPASPRRELGASGRSGARSRSDRRNPGSRDRSLEAVRRLLDRGERRGSSAVRPGASRRGSAATSRSEGSRPRSGRASSASTPRAGGGVRDRSLDAVRRLNDSRGGRPSSRPQARSTTPRRSGAAGRSERSSGVSRSGSSQRRQHSTPAARPSSPQRRGGTSSAGPSRSAGPTSGARSRSGSTRRGSRDRNHRER